MFTYIVNGENGATFMPGSPDVTTFHRISVRKDAAAPRLHGPLPFGRRAHRIDAHRRCAHPGACLSIDRNIFDRRCTARHGDRSEECASQAFASTLATEITAIINSSQIVLVRLVRTPRGYDPTELAVDKNEVSNLVNYILARKPFTLSRLE